MKILYFAWLRERLNRSEEDIDLPADVVTVSDLIAHLSGRDEAFAMAFEKPNRIRAAIDTRIVGHDTPLAGGTTVALFPPMTGG
ncbi:MAG: molybdopterin converting factor subunit 1 [Devosia sp.]